MCWRGQFLCHLQRQCLVHLGRRCIWRGSKTNEEAPARRRPPLVHKPYYLRPIIFAMFFTSSLILKEACWE
jgi:hypothetical protein